MPPHSVIVHTLAFSIIQLDPTVTRRRARSLLLWLFVALQAMTPFIHAHADGLQFGRTGFFHLYQDLLGEADSPALAADPHGVEVGVAQGMQHRIGALDAASHPQAALAPWQAHAEPASRPGAGLPAPPQLQRVPPDHTRPLALAPPLA